MNPDAPSLAVVALAGPLLLFWMMFVVGLELSLEDFRRVMRFPVAIAVGTLAQWLLLPLSSGLLIRLFQPEDDVAAGVILLAAAPGGGISNVFCYLAGANVALSVTLTAVASLFAVLTLPLVTATGFAWFVGSQGAVEVPVVAMIGQLALFVLLPIGLGMWMHETRPGFGRRYAALLRRTVLVAIVLLMGAGLVADDSGLVGAVLDNALLGLAWTVAAMAIGLAVGFALRPDGRDRFTFLIEFSVKNVGLAALVALSGFGRPELAVFSGSYVLLGYPLAAAACWGFGRAYGSTTKRAR